MAEPVVTIKQGCLRGAEIKSEFGGSYISFKGIPYAVPPVGDLRFADPQPPATWTGVREAVKDPSRCLQADMITSKIMGQEDCLYVNVATRSLKGSRPVMAWIHGGAFICGFGGSETYSPDYLMKTDIVFVSINYRVGVLGFLHLDHEVAPGNMGLKDQVAALKWVKENISQFGGDPNNVTIFGESAGGASVHYLLLSPLAKGLFHKAISQSGVAINPWACVQTPADFPRKFVAALGKETDDPHEMIQYLRSIPAEKLVEAQSMVRSDEDRIRGIFPFRPTIDSKSRQPFMPVSPHELAAEGVDVPLLIGYNSHEGIIFLMGLTDERLALTNKKFHIVVSHHVSHDSASTISEVGNAVRKYYFGDKEVNNKSLEEFVQCYGDIHFTTGIHTVVEFQRKKKTPTYFYKFTYKSPKSFSQAVAKSPVKGTAHADDLPYIFYRPIYGEILKYEPDTTERMVSNRFVRMWTDFAKTGNPTPQIDDLITVKWEPVTRTTKYCLQIDEDLSVMEDPDEDVCELSKVISEIFASQ